MIGLKARSILVGTTLLLGTISGTAAVSAATVSHSATNHRHPRRNFWRYWHRTHPRNLYVVESDSGSGGLFGEGQLVVETASKQMLTINLDHMSRAFLTRGLGGRDRARIDPTTLAAGDFVVVRSEIIDVRNALSPNPNGAVLLAIVIDDTGFNPANPATATATPTPGPSATPTATPPAA
ncbi:MAG TPA: hypothetical protein VNN74_05805 [Candidatus Micrarchaeia archaeon]|nr:hypothetical protein [Candidatus Micrarchaeia archaeon]